MDAYYRNLHYFRSQIFYVRNFRVTIFSSISRVCHIFATYNTIGKYSCKKFSSFWVERKFFNKENFTNYGMQGQLYMYNLKKYNFLLCL